MTEPYTPDPADVELVARTAYEADAAQVIGDEQLTWDEQDDRARDGYRTTATAVLAALAGRLVPADAETRREYKYVLTYADGEQTHGTCDSLAVARNVAASPACWNPPGPPGEVFQRDITTLVGPWLPVPEPDGGKIDGPTQR